MTAFEWIVVGFALFGLFAFLVTVAGIIAGLCSGKQPKQRIIVTLIPDETITGGGKCT